MPLDVAFSLEGDERAAWSIIFSEYEGLEMDWAEGTLKAPKQ